MSRLIDLVKRSPIFTIALLVVTIGGGYGLYNYFKDATAGPKTSPSVAVEVEEARVGSLTRTITAVGTLRANQTVEIRSELSGLISKIFVRGGEYVQSGAPMFEIDERTYKAELQDAEARLAHAKVDFDRSKKLLSQNVTSGKKYDEAEANFKVAEATVEKAQANLARTKIIAPFEGLVGLHSISLGMHLDSSKDLVTLVDLSLMKADFKIPAEYLPYVSVGQKIEVTVDGFETTPFPGIIEVIDSKVDPVTHSISARAIMPNQKHILRPGLFARVDVVVGTKSNALIIPAVAVEKEGDQDMVYKVVEGIAFHVPVILGIQEGDNVEIVRGLNPGDHIITVGQMKIRDGVPVRYTLNGKQYTFDEKSMERLQKLLGKGEDAARKEPVPTPTAPAKPAAPATSAKPAGAPVPVAAPVPAAPQAAKP
ncbi:MAG: efflux RND transporter periplasmic adaptor subunit [Alphaproteobacteria bacterium]|nr:efflux RND transporter periplasmic adaptor subunit [Alphaproteobacteria bacterium]